MIKNNSEVVTYDVGSVDADKLFSKIEQTEEVLEAGIYNASFVDYGMTFPDCDDLLVSIEVSAKDDIGIYWHYGKLSKQDIRGMGYGYGDYGTIIGKPLRLDKAKMAMELLGFTILYPFEIECKFEVQEDGTKELLNILCIMRTGRDDDQVFLCSLLDSLEDDVEFTLNWIDEPLQKLFDDNLEKNEFVDIDKVE